MWELDNTDPGAIATGLILKSPGPCCYYLGTDLALPHKQAAQGKTGKGNVLRKALIHVGNPECLPIDDYTLQSVFRQVLFFQSQVGKVR